MIFLTADDIAEFNAEIVPHGRPEDSKIESVARRVLNAHHYDGVNDVYQLAAIYLIAIGRGHIFLDGNKRTAFQSMVLYLAINGVDLRASHQLEELTVEAAQGNLDIEQIADQLRLLTE
ncbi:type II toxin-antitoxin system death-on-curing family toxin [Yersinia massiliensis]|uniref:type II toxin-antitoxin system death-on-curing family toxin n=1 Tax=Yersinia massiliensis TaxID=419257 RepID=UPI0011A3FA1E|nr:type II toxin-antitoxin system death-on-curing family toxin [Yersinia massiliensis]MCB5309946.1 type II toxin-antitoxin system death-on-curing family toxin [Yersinia massiliensis]